uniref:Transforming growth factor, beta 1 n=1 Tax=Mus musculus TaxID=10090 RepID=E9Q6I6_MOUSE
MPSRSEWRAPLSWAWKGVAEPLESSPRGAARSRGEAVFKTQMKKPNRHL